MRIAKQQQLSDFSAYQYSNAWNKTKKNTKLLSKDALLRTLQLTVMNWKKCHFWKNCYLLQFMVFFTYQNFERKNEHKILVTIDFWQVENSSLALIGENQWAIQK